MPRSELLKTLARQIDALEKTAGTAAKCRSWDVDQRKELTDLHERLGTIASDIFEAGNEEADEGD